VFFVGVTSPSSAVSKVVEGITSLKKNALKKGVDILIINTDGWIEGEDAVRYKVALVKSVKPNLLVGIQEQSELTFMLGALTETKKLTVETPSAVRKRSHEERKLLRELSYKKYLKGARAEAFPLRWAVIGDFAFGTGGPPSWEHMKKIEESFGAMPLYCEETSNSVFIALSKRQWSSEEFAKDLEQKLNKQIIVMREDDEEGLLVGLHDSTDNFSGIGVLESIDYERRIIRVYTPVRRGVASLRLGRVKLDKKGKEIGLTEVFAGYW
jgi:polynucleotide 5'-hydroxyl-kinase GRC3/NOL9